MSRLWRLIRSEITAVYQNGTYKRTSASRRNQGRTRSESAGSGERARANSSANSDLARHYAALEIPYGSDLETVRQAYKRLMKKYHPDRHARDPEKQRVATEVVKQINHAYSEISKYLNGK